jgi:hypothetical protein
MPVSTKKYSINTHKFNYFYSLDCQSGEGLKNPLLMKLRKISSAEFNYYLNFFLKKCINVNRSFSDAVEFLSIWLKKSPDTLLEKLKNAELKRDFYRTEYDHDGDKWYFPKLLKDFAKLVDKENTADEILGYLFEIFDFFNIPETFVSVIIGYDRLPICIQEIRIGEMPSIFQQALLSKMNEFVAKNHTIDIGLRSRKYLQREMFKKGESDKQENPQELVEYIKCHLFFYPTLRPQDRNHPYISSTESTCKSRYV